MKYVFLLVCCIVLSFEAQAQRLSGMFYPEEKHISWIKELFYFKENNEIIFAIRGCTGIAYGKGKYQIQKDSLIIDFEDIENRPVLYTISNQTVNDSSFVEINTKVICANDSSELPGVNIHSFYYSSFGCVTDMYGNSKFKLPTRHTYTDTDTLYISMVGFTPVSVPINTSSPQKFDINVVLEAGSNYYYKKGEQEKFKINWIRGNSFQLQIKEDYKVTYQRISKKRYNKLIKR